MPVEVEIKNIQKTYVSPKGKSVEVLHDVSFDVEKGSFLTILGPSGSGKSTLLMICSGLVRPDSGEVLVDGSPVNGPSPSLVSVVFQDASLLPWRTVSENVEFGLEIKGIPKDERKRKAMEYLSVVGLKGFENYFPGQISGGMQQRCSVARALALETNVILMDEPFGALDEQSRFYMGQELTRIWQETGKTIVFVTHSISEAAFLSDKVALISARPGSIRKVIGIDTPRPREPEDERLMSVRREMWDHISTESSLQEGKEAEPIKKEIQDAG